MSAQVQHLIEALADRVERHDAHRQLVALGAAVVEPLLHAWKEGDAARRKAILRVLSELQDERAVDVFRSSLDDRDEVVRATAAQGLYRLATPDAIEALARTIDDSPDPLHFDVTPSVQALSAIGRPALPVVLALLDSHEPRTRQRAQRVLDAVAERNDSYRWDAPEQERAESLRRLRQWLLDQR